MTTPMHLVPGYIIMEFFKSPLEASKHIICIILPCTIDVQYSITINYYGSNTVLYNRIDKYNHNRMVSLIK